MSETTNHRSAHTVLVQGLRALGADGLCHIDRQCGCGIEGVEPCDAITLLWCNAAKKHDFDHASNLCVECGENCGTGGHCYVPLTFPAEPRSDTQAGAADHFADANKNGRGGCMSYVRYTTRCSFCGVQSNNQRPGDGCHACLCGVMW